MIIAIQCASLLDFKFRRSLLKCITLMCSREARVFKFISLRLKPISAAQFWVAEKRKKKRGKDSRKSH